MPNIKSQKKRVLTSAKEAARNKAVKSNLKTTLKKAEAAIISKADDMGDVVNKASSTIDKAAKSGVIHKNAANRKKAQLAKKANG